jgi:hypothetical protein
MTTIRQIIIDAFRETGILGVDEEPDADQFAEGLRRINVLYDSLFGSELGEPLITRNYGKAGLTNVYGQAEDISLEVTSVYLPTNTRLILNLDNSATVYLDPNPRDGARIGVIDSKDNLATYNVVLNGNGRNVESTSSITLATNSLNRTWFYREDLGNWVRVSDLVAGDSSPFPNEFDDLLTTMLAFRLNPRYGAETSTEMIEVLKRMRKMFRARYRQIREEGSEPGLYRLSSLKRYWRGDSFNG